MYYDAINWISKSSEVMSLVKEHLGIYAHSDSNIHFAVMDTIIPDFGWTFFDDSSCGVLEDGTKISEKYSQELVFFQDAKPEYYQDFTHLWNETDELVLIFGMRYKNKVIASLYPRSNSIVSPELAKDSSSSLTGISVQQMSSNSIDEIIWQKDSIMVIFCFDNRGTLSNAVVMAMSS
jgi:hypothetical protein